MMRGLCQGLINRSAARTLKIDEAGIPNVRVRKLARASGQGSLC